MTQESASVHSLKDDDDQALEASDTVSTNAITDPDPVENPFTTIKTKLDEYYSSGATRSLSWRKRQLKAFYNLLEKEEKLISEAIYQDLGKSPEETYLTEIGYLKKETKTFLKNVRKWMKPIQVSSPLLAYPAKSLIIPEPLGTCLVIGSWNYPFQLSMSPMLAAISAGNCVVVKPSELAECTSSIIAELLPKYLDMNAITIIEGGEEPTSNLLELAFDKIFYTGGERVGKIVMSAASKHLTPVTLELGGKSPCIIDKNIDFKIALNRVVWGKFVNVGQTCIAPDYLLVHHSNLDNVLNQLKASIAKQYTSKPETNRFYGRIVNKAHCNRLISYLEGQDVIYGGKHDVDKRYLEPTIVLNPALDSPLMQEEIFGPILPIISFSGRSDMLKFISARPKPLAAYAFTQDKEFEQKFVERISAGSICINDIAMFFLNPKLPFGGVGSSGMGNYHGKYGFDAFSHQKAVLKRGYSLENSIRYMPLNKLKASVLKFFLK